MRTALALPLFLALAACATNPDTGKLQYDPDRAARDLTYACGAYTTAAVIYDSVRVSHPIPAKVDTAVMLVRQFAEPICANAPDVVVAAQRSPQDVLLTIARIEAGALQMRTTAAAVAPEAPAPAAAQNAVKAGS